ncbi:hypothetical protein [Sphingomonas sp.]|jgi:hypothetical protein|uniref:hypothetical protein n=1 Tax=Sphingomonas sp. TaxID=28214 RepID=UPI002D7F61CE|nr:hypothetical protein [Sphingomonas sp.]HEU0045487.1 hypothetical protein [Sphingomonas sp.]
MTDESHSNPAAAPVACVPSTPSGGRAATPRGGSVLDANGFDPAEFEWRPVPRRARKDGWTTEVQQAFIEALARTGIVEQACQEVNRSVQSAYTLRNARGGEGFARAWAAVLTRAADRLLDVAFEQAILGEEIPVFDQDGVRVGSKRRYNTRMAITLLKAYHPERFRHVDKEVRRADEPPPAPAVPVAEVIDSLAPVTPAEPHLLGPPEQMKSRIISARDEGERLAAAPPEPPEGHRWPRVPDPHPRVLAHAARQRARRERREQREDALYGNAHAERLEEAVDEPAARDPGCYAQWLEEHPEDRPAPTARARHRRK